MKQEKITYQFVKMTAPRLKMKDRVLLFLVERDLEAGRDGDVSEWFGDLRETLFMYSSSFLHSPELTFLNVLFWEELREYGHPDELGRGGIELPPAHVGVAAIPVGKRRSFSLAIKKLMTDKLIHSFVPTMRAIDGLGGKAIPLLQLWNERNRDKLRDIVGISLTEKGFLSAKKLAENNSVMMPWQFNKRVAKDKRLAEWITGRKETPNTSE